MNAEPIYLDASAIVKLVSREPESDALVAWMAHHPEGITSALSRVEVGRAALRSRLGPGAHERCSRIFEHLTVVSIDETVVDLATRLPGDGLRSLDALHLATALSIGDFPAAFVTYDDRLGHAAEAAGLVVVSPGRQPG